MGLYRVWEHGDDRDAGTASKNPVQQRRQTCFKRTVSCGAPYGALVGGKGGKGPSHLGSDRPKIFTGHDTCELGQVTAPH